MSRSEGKKDIKSGFRGNAEKWYLSQRNVYQKGADLKVPWETARLYHLPQLAVFSIHKSNLTTQYIREFKNQTSPWLLLAMILAIATFVLGGAVVTKTVPAWAHQTLFYVTVVVQIVTLRRETRVLIANERLISDINRRVTP